MLLSLCMIVRNEEHMLEKCLKGAAPAVDEIIIVDTGSTDNTKNICSHYHAKVYDFEWTENFSEARNFGLEQAAGKWILWLDADEEPDLDDISVFRKILETTDKDLWLIPMINYYGTFPPDPNRAYLFSGHRLFRHRKGYKFIGNIHEHLNVGQLPGYTAPETMPGIRIHHYGYMDPLVVDKKKYERNLSMLKKEMEQPNYSPWIDYHVASEYYRAGRYEEAFDQVNLSILKFIRQSLLPPSLLYKLKYDILISSGSFDGARAGIEKAIDLYPEYVDLHFYKALILFEKKEFEEAIAVLKHCLKLGDKHINYLTMAGCGGYLAWYHIGRCHEALGNSKDAIAAYTQAICLYPGLQEAHARLAALK